MVEKLPQRMNDVLKTIGENAVLFRLFVLLYENPEWNVYQNLADKGCDIVLINSINNNKIKIEVKTRQKLYTTSTNLKRGPQFTLSENEYNSCDFLVGYWFERNQYYIVPKENLYKAKNKELTVYKYAAPFNGLGVYHDNWSAIEIHMKLMSL
jgi:hypothetical protein